MNTVASVKDRLKNKTKETGKTMEQLLVFYGLERTIYRISVSPYAERFTLKGGIFLYGLFNGNYARMTTDIDLLAQRISNDVEEMKKVFTTIFEIRTDDPLRYDLETLEVKAITEFKEYHGVNVSIVAYLDRTRIPVAIDIGYSDVIFPGRIEMCFPAVLDETGPKIYAYSIESCIAEKFEALVSLGYDNSRYKDFYDLYVLSNARDFDGLILQEAIRETFNHRKTSLTGEPVIFNDDFTNDPIRKSRWNSFVKKKRTMLSVSMEEVLNSIKIFIFPLFEATKSGEPFTYNWDHRLQKWK